MNLVSGIFITDIYCLNKLIIISYLKCDDMVYKLNYLLIVMNQKLPYRSIENLDNLLLKYQMLTSISKLII